MNVTIKTRHMEITTSLGDYARQKAEKLSKYYDRIHDVEVVFDAGKDTILVEMIATVEPKTTLIAKHSMADAYACVDDCIAKLERQLAEYKKRVRNRKHAGGEEKGEAGLRTKPAPEESEETEVGSE